MAGAQKSFKRAIGCSSLLYGGKKKSVDILPGYIYNIGLKKNDL
jgi:hypothetical protein